MQFRLDRILVDASDGIVRHPICGTSEIRYIVSEGIGNGTDHRASLGGKEIDWNRLPCHALETAELLDGQDNIARLSVGGNHGPFPRSRPLNVAGLPLEIDGSEYPHGTYLQNTYFMYFNESYVFVQPGDGRLSFRMRRRGVVAV
jgi:hypothetical protein